MQLTKYIAIKTDIFNHSRQLIEVFFRHINLKLKHPEVHSFPLFYISYFVYLQKVKNL